MKIQKIMCDRCGKEITGNPIKIYPEIVDRENGDLLIGTVLPSWDGDLLEHDFCEECTEKIMRFAKGEMEDSESEPPMQPQEPTEKEQKPTARVKPKAIPKAKPTETNENQQKPTVKDLILQGMSKAEVIKLTGCKESSYNQTKYLLKKEGLLMDVQIKQMLDESKDASGDAKTYKCSEVGGKCIYRAGQSKEVFMCDYIGKTGHRRGCNPEQCDKFKEK